MHSPHARNDHVGFEAFSFPADQSTTLRIVPTQLVHTSSTHHMHLQGDIVMLSIPKMSTNSSIPIHTRLDRFLKDLCAGLGGLLGLLAPQLLCGGSLDGLVGLADGGGAGDGVLAEVGAVVALGGAVDDGGVDPGCC